MALQFASFALTVVLARLLSPDDFGLFAMITVFSNFGMLFKDLGFGHALIYHKDSSAIEFHSVFVINLAIGITFSLLFFLLAPVIASFYGEPRLESLTKVFSVVFIIQAFGSVNITELKKKVDFRSLMIVENAAYFLSAIIAILLAFIGFGVWSLIVKTVLNITLLTIFVYTVSTYRPKISFNAKIVKGLWVYSYQVSGNGFLTYWMRNLDNLMIGKMIGQQPLGIYNMAYSIMLLPMKNISSVIKDVLFPSFSSVGNKVKRIRTVYLKVVQTVALVTFPLLAGLACLSDLFVPVLFGDHWAGMIPVLTLLSLVAIPQSIFTINGTIYLNTGRPDIPLKINLVSLPLYAAGFYIGLRAHGVLGLVYAYITVYTILMIPNYFFCAKQIDLTLTEFLEKLWPVIISVAFMSLFVLLSKWFIQSNTDTALYPFLISVCVGVVAYIVSVFMLKRKMDIVHLLFEKETQAE